MDTEKINWVNDFRINESLHSSAQDLSAAYGRMHFNNSTHEEAKTWQENSIRWAEYEHSIKDLKFNTEEQAFAEVERLGKECKRILELEKKLLDPRKQEE